MEDWVSIRDYSAMVQADFDKATLEEAGIPAIVKGAFVGAFGPNFMGAPPFGIRLLVPADAVEEARDILGIDEDEDE